MYTEHAEHAEVITFFKAVLALETIDECDKFFVDICTVSEVKAIAQRLQVARMLHEGHTYMQIEEKTGASTATISRVKRFLQYGSGGYKLMLERMNKL